MLDHIIIIIIIIITSLNFIDFKIKVGLIYYYDLYMLYCINKYLIEVLKL